MGFFLILIAISTSVFIIILPTFFSQDKIRTELNKVVKLEHILDTKKEIELVFFGYVGCTDVCTPRLEDLASWYKTLPQGMKNKFSIRFINLSKLQDPDQVQLFVKAFDNDFLALYLEQNELRKYTKTFFVHFAKSLLDDFEMNHTVSSS